MAEKKLSQAKYVPVLSSFDNEKKEHNKNHFNNISKILSSAQGVFNRLTAMKKFFLFFLLIIIGSSSVHAQISVAKLVGKSAERYKLGYCLFSFIDFPIKSTENQSIRLELMDLAFFPGKNGNFFTTDYGRAYISIKVGYKYIFSETRTGFYIEPSAGYARVVDVLADRDDPLYGDGYALAVETGYSLEVGQRDHVMNFGIKYETDRSKLVLSSVGFRVSYAFNIFGKKEY
jgi:hypothetical protein